MRYEVLHKAPQHDPQFLAGTPLEIRLHPEDTDVRQMFVALVQAAYEMGGARHIGGHLEVDAPDTLSEKEALRTFSYDSKWSLWGWVRGIPDTRIPVEVGVGYIHGRAIRFWFRQSEEVPGTYDWNTILFLDEVGSMDNLFARAQQNLDKHDE